MKIKENIVIKSSIKVSLVINKLSCYFIVRLLITFNQYFTFAIIQGI